jgi:hypothetical protein
MAVYGPGRAVTTLLGLMKIILLLLGLWLAAGGCAFGCINEYYVTLKGNVVEYFTGLPRYARSCDRDASRIYYIRRGMALNLGGAFYFCRRRQNRTET